MWTRIAAHCRVDNHDGTTYVLARLDRRMLGAVAAKAVRRRAVVRQKTQQREGPGRAVQAPAVAVRGVGMQPTHLRLAQEQQVHYS